MVFMVQKSDEEKSLRIRRKYAFLPVGKVTGSLLVE